MTQEITYTEVNGYLIPNLTLPDEPEYDIGRFGLITEQMAKAEGVTEQLKAVNKRL